ncbi:peptidylprolyl isomerase [Rhodococcus tukisamuensis]|uniref:Peptidylprolyl isomerase/peptidyl-prolyl cis-trans isomerase B (Cyclophilin B) n=1 Tax=Rhodococcus tukisamuensis TaxID=168276 RepID=A0A1G6QP37_9NOCA|nr:peptidylprolyl isomerase [Rhodococcus tukisamuensis]SDC94089.1 peptidylprolyl isomerase/peptidyl-prolyl cis-trans isomerase B (cyclophilin B) [Rhodococcus tukisamuensis]
MKRTLIVAAGVGLALVTGACSSSTDNSAGGSSATSATTSATSSGTTINPPDLSSYPKLPAATTPTEGTAACSYPASGQPVKPVTPPPSAGVQAEGTAEVTMATSQGPIGLSLNRAEAPCTVNSFVSLAEQGYYNDTPCHRLSTSGLYILQCGDPSGTGRGGPGYGYLNEYPSTQYTAADPAGQQPVVYPRGTIAMANTGQPGSNGSQFFLVYEDSPLAPQYTVFGTISEEGLATIEKVATAGNDESMPAGGGKPNTPVQIEKVTVG